MTKLNSMSLPKKEISTQKSIIIFEDHPVRRVWIEKDGKWYFAIPDVVQVLTDTVNPTGYVKDMRRRDPELSKGWGQIATPPFFQSKSKTGSRK